MVTRFVAKCPGFLRPGGPELSTISSVGEAFEFSVCFTSFHFVFASNTSVCVAFACFVVALCIFALVFGRCG